MPRLPSLLLLPLLLAPLSVNRAWARDRLVVHEWGTFTALQNDAGLALPGINVDDESLPSFVHDVNSQILHQTFSLGIPSKGAPQRHPYVTLRLETPVMYFHLPSDKKTMKVDVDVALRGGWLTQFYPTAEVSFPGVNEVKENNYRLEPLVFGPISPRTVGRLAWHGVTIGANGQGPNTASGVWNAPRKVQAAMVASTDGEAEKYLFYRGVGNFPAPLQVVSTIKDGHRDLEFHARFEDVLKNGEKTRIDRSWLVEIRRNGDAAFRAVDGFDVTADSKSVVARTSAEFRSNDFSADGIKRLHEELHAALVKEGLYADEGTALIETWKQAYFKTPGLRVFFLVPRVWTDHQLPLTVSAVSDIRRAMVGRIELVSSEQKSLLKTLSTATITPQGWINEIKNSPAAQRFYSGHSDFGDLGVKIPADFQMYLDLGRFRDALVLAEQKAHPSKSLEQLIHGYNLNFFDLPPAETVNR